MVRIDVDSELEGADPQVDRIGRRLFEQVISTYTPLAKRDPAYELWVAMGRGKLAQIAAGVGAWQEVYDQAQRALTLFSRAAKRSSPHQRLVPKVGTMEGLDPEAGVSTALLTMASAEVQLKRPADADRHLRQGLEIVRKLAKRDPEKFRVSLAEALSATGFEYEEQQRWAESAAAYKEALAIYRQLPRESPPPALAPLVILNGDLFEISQKLGEPPVVFCAYLTEAWKESEGSSDQRLIEYKAFRAYRDGLCTAELLAPIPDPEDTQQLAPMVDANLSAYDAAALSNSYEACGKLIDAWQLIEDLPRRRAVVQRKAEEAVKAGRCVEGFLTDPEETSMAARLLDIHLAMVDLLLTLKHQSACASLIEVWGKSDGLARRRATIQQRAQKVRDSGLCTAQQMAPIIAQD